MAFGSSGDAPTLIPASIAPVPIAGTHNATALTAFSPGQPELQVGGTQQVKARWDNNSPKSGMQNPEDLGQRLGRLGENKGGCKGFLK